jgi:sugar phosphate isomerase/epimerase
MSLMWGGSRLTAEALPAWLDEVAAAGYEGVATFEALLLQWVEEADLGARLRDAGLAMVSVDVRVSRDFDRQKQIYEAMQSLGARHAVCLSGLARESRDFDEVADVLNRMGELALQYGVRAGYHNHTGDIGETLEQTETLLARTDPDKFFGFLDVGHATKDFVGYPVSDRAAFFLERHWDRIDFLEFKDWSEEHDLCTEVGAGLCDYDRVFGILEERGYTGWITVEQNGPMGDKTALQCARASREFIRRGLGV